MDTAAMIRKYGATVLGTIGVALWLVALYLLASAAQNSAEFDRWLPWILLINIPGCSPYSCCSPASSRSLVRDYRRHVPGPPEGTHGGDFQRAGGGADPGRLLLFAAILTAASTAGSSSK